jgi:hypothetical protein
MEKNIGVNEQKKLGNKEHRHERTRNKHENRRPETRGQRERKKTKGWTRGENTEKIENKKKIVEREGVEEENT